MVYIFDRKQSAEQHYKLSKDRKIEPLRLNKYLSQCGVASRRAADGLIESGRVKVNGTVAETGAKIIPGKDRVTVDNTTIAPRLDHITIILNKPVQVVTTLNDPQGRRTVLDLLPPRFRDKRPVPVGRLDYFSEGLLLLTTDGELCNRLTHPRHHLEKTYEVTVRGYVREEALQTMRSGMTLAEGEKLAPIQVRAAKGNAPDSTVLEMVLKQGVNRQIRRMCRDLGLTILTLRRIAQGPIRLQELEPGRCRELSPEELARLRTAVRL